ncbi:MAG: family 16 glycoside hydrolase [Chloroflexota bacterium]
MTDNLIANFLIPVGVVLAVALIVAGLAWIFSLRFRAWTAENRRLVGLVLLVFLIAQLPFVIYLTLEARPPLAGGVTLDSTWQKLLDDKFSNVDSQNNWELGSTTHDVGESQLTLGKGKLRWRLTCNTDASTSMNFYTGLKTQNSLSDAYFQVDARLLSGPEETTYGVYFRGTAEAFYYLSIDEQGQTFRLDLWQQGKWTNLYPSTTSDKIVSGKSNRIGVLLRGSQIRIYINDQLVGELTNDQLVTGAIGLGGNIVCPAGSSFEFDNALLYTP